ncbi:MAG: hypothetical protein QGG71_27335, partial [Pirellulaceae bacterium]|nr:hypothetical protein [Pirellulaceae bacterium]
MTPMIPRSIVVGLTLTCLLVPIGSAVAQSDAKTLIAEAYRQTKEAKTVGQLTTIIDLCQQALKA